MSEVEYISKNKLCTQENKCLISSLYSISIPSSKIQQRGKTMNEVEHICLLDCSSSKKVPT